MQIATVVWAEAHIDVPELKKIKEQFTLKYGQKEIDESASNTNSLVDPTVIAKVLPCHPSDEEITRKVREVAAERGLEYRPSDKLTEVLPHPELTVNHRHGSVTRRPGRPRRQLRNPRSPSSLKSTPYQRRKVPGSEDEEASPGEVRGVPREPAHLPDPPR